MATRHIIYTVNAPECPLCLHVKLLVDFDCGLHFVFQVPHVHRQHGLPNSRCGQQLKLKHKCISQQHTTVPSKRAKPAHRKSLLPPPPPHPKSHDSTSSTFPGECREPDAQTKMLLLIVQVCSAALPYSWWLGHSWTQVRSPGFEQRQP